MALPVKGELGILSVWDGIIFRPVACLTSNSLASTVSVIESQTKCNPGLVIKQGGVLLILFQQRASILTLQV